MRTLPRHTRGLGCHPSKLICRDRNPHLTITRHPTLCHLLRVCGPVTVHPVVACIAPNIWNTTCFPILSVGCSQSWLVKVMPLGLDWSAHKPMEDTIGYCYFLFFFLPLPSSFSCLLELFDIFGDALLSLLLFVLRWYRFFCSVSISATTSPFLHNQTASITRLPASSADKSILVWFLTLFAKRKSRKRKKKVSFGSDLGRPCRHHIRCNSFPCVYDIA